MELCDDGIWVSDDLNGVNDCKDGESIYLCIEFENDLPINILFSKKNFEYFKKRINEIEWK